MRDYLRLAPLLLFLLVAILLSTGLFNGPRQRPSPLLGKPLSAIALPLVGRPAKFMLSRDWQRKTVLINAFASWCEPCREEEPALLQLSAQMGVPIYGIAWRDTQAAAAAYLQQNGNPYKEVAVDAQGQTTVPLGLTGVPETMLVDSSGIVRWKYAGPLTGDVVANELQPLLKQYGGR